MENTITEDIWVRPWDKAQTIDLYQKDERFFALVLKGLLSFLNKNIILNGESINHFIFNTGSSYMYMENTDYNFSWCETTGEDQMYMKMPRCIIELGDVNVDMAELSSPYVRGNYERLSSIDNKIKTYNAEIKRMPLEISISLKYVLSTFNESIILLQELIDKLLFQRYFNIVYLGQKIICSVEFPSSTRIEFNKIDMLSADTNQKNINIELKICTNYPIINRHTEINANTIIRSFGSSTNLVKNQSMDNVTDLINNTTE
jgi:hypothetical protein